MRVFVSDALPTVKCLNGFQEKSDELSEENVEHQLLKNECSRMIVSKLPLQTIS